MQHIFTLEEKEHALWLAPRGETYALRLDGEIIPVVLNPLSANDYVLELGDEAEIVTLVTDGDEIHLHLRGRSHTLHYRDPVIHLAGAGAANAASVVHAPMPGTVITLKAVAGASVSMGDALLVIESMKLETTIRAWRDGEVAEVHVREGQQFDRGALLLTLKSEGE